MTEEKKATPAREAQASRTTGETSVSVFLSLDEAGSFRARTGVGFLDHMLHALAFHAGWSLRAKATGDLGVDDHHTVEDVGLVLGKALRRCIGDGSGIARFGDAHAPLDEALARAVVDLSGRPAFQGSLGLKRERLGDLSCEMAPHFFASFSRTAGLALHLDVLRGENDHHKLEAAFKALALALRQALARTPNTAPPSTKGVL